MKFIKNFSTSMIKSLGGLGRVVIAYMSLEMAKVLTTYIFRNMLSLWRLHMFKQVLKISFMQFFQVAGNVYAHYVN